MTSSSGSEDGRVHCIICRYRFDEATCVDGTNIRPKKGDVSICLRCGAVLVFTGQGIDVRLANPAELRELMTDPTILMAVTHIKERNAAGYHLQSDTLH